MILVQVAINNQLGTSRGFAFVDYETSEEAERGQIAHNYARLGNFNIRTSYGTPGRSGASILGPLLPAIAQVKEQCYLRLTIKKGGRLNCNMSRKGVKCIKCSQWFVQYFRINIILL